MYGTKVTLHHRAYTILMILANSNKKCQGILPKFDASFKQKSDDVLSNFST